MRAALAVALLLLGTSAPALAATRPSQLAAGKAVFHANCAKCHTFAAAGTRATDVADMGPVLTGLHLSTAKVLHMVASGSDVMPSFLGVLTSAQMNEVAAFVASGSAAK
jgi:mono/diheme cytochrome c family protein